MITLKNIALRRGKQVLFEHVNWTIYHKQRIGIIGANGAGKSSLFAMLLGKLQPDAGDLELPRQFKLGHVAQETPAYAKSALDFVIDGDAELRQLEQQLVQAEAENDGMQMGHIYEKMSIIDAYTAPSRAAQLLSGLGFSQVEQQQSVNSFSGGWRVRLNLAQALMSRADMLLLDEPTNHLDLDAVLWLEKWLQQYQGTLLLISHDRDFLDRTVDHIGHLYQQQFKLYGGNYSVFEKERAAYLLQQQAAYEKQQRQLSHMQDFVNRFKAKASKARQAQSRLKAIEKIELVAAVQTESPFQFEFKTPAACPNPLLQLTDASVAYGDHVVLKDLSVSIQPKDRIAILGPNGAGKSSFIKLLAGEIEPATGLREVSPGLKIGYFAQHQIDYLHLDDSALLHLKRIAESTAEVELRKFLGRFDFSGDKVLEPVKTFSGGEKSRLALALIVWQKPNLLLLDEPTNHLDLEMRQALGLALQSYEGAMMLVSHDRFLVRMTTDQLYLIANQKLAEFSGDLQEYEQWLLDFRKAQQASSRNDKAESIEKNTRQKSVVQREKLKPLLKKIEQLESKLARLEKELLVVEQVLADEKLYQASEKEKLQNYLQQQIKIKKDIETTEQAWLAACEEKEKFES